MDILKKAIQKAVYAIDTANSKNKHDLRYVIKLPIETSDMHYLVTWFNIETNITVTGYTRFPEYWLIDFSWR